MYAVILAGGKGKRFWPASKVKNPKQFLDIYGDGSMLSITFKRLAALVPKENIFLITVKDQLKLAKEKLPDISPQNIFAEPAGRNTAPALAIAALLVKKRGNDEPILVCPADHLIKDNDIFYAAVHKARKLAEEKDYLVTFGIEPEYPATGYGYIEVGDKLENETESGFYRVARFHEKPNFDLATEYIKTGGYYWNSGIFMWRPSVYLEAWLRYFSSGSDSLLRIEESIGKKEMRKVISEEYLKFPATSVDYGILEKADNVVVIPAKFGWNDVGSWDSLFDIISNDSLGNVKIGESELLDSKNCLFFNPEGFTAAIGVENIMVVSDGSTVLVCRRGESERVREIVELLEEKGLKKFL
ncbi:mannose-1-phosphate guanylyltransferase [bacterium]|nr:mannose-1-phosphate guanylyltransferase [bacterium]